MNLNNIRKEPALAAVAAGFLGLMLRAVLYRTGFDEKGILSASHPLHLACLLLAAIAAVYLTLQAGKLPEVPEARPRLRCLLGICAGCFLLIHGLELFLQPSWPMSVYPLPSGQLYNQISGMLPLLRCLLTISAAVAMGYCTAPGIQGFPAASCHGMICVSLAADMLGRYRDWSGNPQLPDYVFHVLAGVALSLTAYQTLALHTELSRPVRQKFWCLSALMLCVMCLSGPAPRAFYLSGAFWAAACLLTVVPPEEDPLQEEETDVPA